MGLPAFLAAKSTLFLNISLIVSLLPNLPWHRPGMPSPVMSRSPSCAVYRPVLLYPPALNYWQCLETMSCMDLMHCFIDGSLRQSLAHFTSHWDFAAFSPNRGSVCCLSEVQNLEFFGCVEDGVYEIRCDMCEDYERGQSRDGYEEQSDDCPLHDFPSVAPAACCLVLRYRAF